MNPERGEESMRDKMGELDIKAGLREERDRLLEVERALDREDREEALRLIRRRLATIKENLED